MAPWGSHGQWPGQVDENTGYGRTWCLMVSDGKKIGWAFGVIPHNATSIYGEVTMFSEQHIIEEA